MLIFPVAHTFLLVPALIAAAPSAQTYELEGQRYTMRLDGARASLYNGQNHIIHLVHIHGSARVVGLLKPQDDPLSEFPGRTVEVDGVTYTIKTLAGAQGESLAVIVLNPQGHIIWAVLPPDPETHI